MPGILIAAELALLPRVFEARTLGQLASTGLGSSLLGLLSYQLFNHHKYRKQLDERWLLHLEERSGALLLHAPRHVVAAALDNLDVCSEPVTAKHFHESWLHALSAMFVWNYVMLAGAGLPLVVTVLRVKHMR